METKKFSGIPMGVAALGAFLPVATTDSDSMKIMGATVSAGTSWGLWLCFFSAVATSVFMFLMVNENPVRQPVPRPRSKAPRRRPPRRR